MQRGLRPRTGLVKKRQIGGTNIKWVTRAKEVLPNGQGFGGEKRKELKKAM